jgi:hypothetical protein
LKSVSEELSRGQWGMGFDLIVGTEAQGPAMFEIFQRTGMHLLALRVRDGVVYAVSRQ